MLAQLTEALDVAQNELAEAEIALLQATARQQEAADAASRLQAAVAALSGEPPTAAKPATDNASALPETSTRSDIQSLSPEEFDKQRRKRQRAKEKELQANNPLAHIPCAGCGTMGSMNAIVRNAPSGAPVRMLECSTCGNQLMQ